MDKSKSNVKILVICLASFILFVSLGVLLGVLAGDNPQYITKIYEDEYSCTIRFAIVDKSENTITGAQSSSDINFGISLAKNYIQIMTQSDSLMQDVANGSGYEITGAQVKDMIEASLVGDTSIIEMRIIATDPEVAYAVAESYVNNYSTTTEKAYQSTRAIVVDEPQMPTRPNKKTKLKYVCIGYGIFVGTDLSILACVLILVFSKKHRQ